MFGGDARRRSTRGSTASLAADEDAVDGGRRAAEQQGVEGVGGFEVGEHGVAEVDGAGVEGGTDADLPEFGAAEGRGAAAGGHVQEVAAELAAGVGEAQARAGAQALVHLEQAGLLDQVDDRVAVAAEREVDPAAQVIGGGDDAVAEVGELSLGGQLKASKLRAAYGYFEQGESSDQFRIDGMVGLDPLLQRRVTFDFPERKLYFADSSAPVKAKAK